MSTVLTKWLVAGVGLERFFLTTSSLVVRFAHCPHQMVGCGSGTRTSRPSGYEPDELPTAPSRDVAPFG